MKKANTYESKWQELPQELLKAARQAVPVPAPVVPGAPEPPKAPTVKPKKPVKPKGTVTMPKPITPGTDKLQAPATGVNTGLNPSRANLNVANAFKGASMTDMANAAKLSIMNAKSPKSTVNDDVNESETDGDWHYKLKELQANPMKVPEAPKLKDAPKPKLENTFDTLKNDLTEQKTAARLLANLRKTANMEKAAFNLEDFFRWLFRARNAKPMSGADMGMGAALDDSPLAPYESTGYVKPVSPTVREMEPIDTSKYEVGAAVPGMHEYLRAQARQDAYLAKQRDMQGGRPQPFDAPTGGLPYRPAGAKGTASTTANPATAARRRSHKAFADTVNKGTVSKERSVFNPMRMINRTRQVPIPQSTDPVDVNDLKTMYIGDNKYRVPSRFGTHNVNDAKQWIARNRAIAMNKAPGKTKTAADGESNRRGNLADFMTRVPKRHKNTAEGLGKRLETAKGRLGQYDTVMGTDWGNDLPALVGNLSTVPNRMRTRQSTHAREQGYRNLTKDPRAREAVKYYDSLRRGGKTQGESLREVREKYHEGMKDLIQNMTIKGLMTTDVSAPQAKTAARNPDAMKANLAMYAALMGNGITDKNDVKPGESPKRIRHCVHNGNPDHPLSKVMAEE